MAKVLIEESTLTEICDAIRAKNGTTDAIPVLNIKTEIEAITGGGESSDLVKYVYFMSEDGSTELFKMPVLSGDDCKDPITHGDIETPTKESDNYYHYNFSGWAMIAGDPSGESALTNVTENRYVYAAFEEETRYYTVNFYDEDGITLLDTVQVEYEADASIYAPTKDGYICNAWTPTVDCVTSDINTVSSWSIDDGFIHDDWGTIANNPDKYELGDKVLVEMTYEDATTEKIVFEIVGKSVDTLTDGTGKANLSFLALNVLKDTIKFDDTGSYVQWGKNPSIYTELQGTFFNALPNELQSVIKTVKKYRSGTYAGQQDCTLWIPQGTEFSSSTSEGIYKEYLNGNYARGTYDNPTSYQIYWLRDNQSAYKNYYVDASGNIKYESGNVTTNSYGVLLGFCI